MALSPPPQTFEWTWQWKNWAWTLFECLTNPVVNVVEDTDMVNSWVNMDSTRKVRYWKDVFGSVHLSGAIKTGTLGTVAFTLPTGFIPDFIDGTDGAFFAVAASNTPTEVGIVQIQPDGDVIPLVGKNTAYGLYGISFKSG